MAEPATPPGVTDDRNTKISSSVTNAPAELNGDTREYVRTAAMGDMFEVEASRVALMRARSAEVKKFAQDMIDAHTKTSDDLKAASAQAFEERYISQQKDAHDEALMLHRNYAMRGTVADRKAFAADLVPKIEMYVKRASELQSGDRTG